MSSDSNTDKTKPNRGTTTKKTETKLAVVETELKPEGPPNVTVRIYGKVVVNKKGKNKE